MSDEDNDQKPARRRQPRNKGAAPQPLEPPPADEETDGDSDTPTAGPVVVTSDSTGEGGSDPMDDDALAATIRANRTRFGELVVHYAERDVTIVLDGASASKVMAVHAGVTTRRAAEDLLIPLVSDMANMWASIDLDRALAMSWIPMLPSIAGRKMTIDPALPEALQA